MLKNDETQNGKKTMREKEEHEKHFMQVTKENLKHLTSH